MTSMWTADNDRDYYEQFNPEGPEPEEPEPDEPEEPAALAAYNPPSTWKDTSPVERAAHLLNGFDYCRAEQFCREEGISDEDIAEGARRASARKAKRREMRSYYGDPAYGSWPERAAKEWAEFEEELCKEEPAHLASWPDEQELEELRFGRDTERRPMQRAFSSAELFDNLHALLIARQKGAK